MAIALWFLFLMLIVQGTIVCLGVTILLVTLPGPVCFGAFCKIVNTCCTEIILIISRSQPGTLPWLGVYVKHLWYMAYLFGNTFQVRKCYNVLYLHRLLVSIDTSRRQISRSLFQRHDLRQNKFLYSEKHSRIQGSYPRSSKF